MSADRESTGRNDSVIRGESIASDLIKDFLPLRLADRFADRTAESP